MGASNYCEINFQISINGIHRLSNVSSKSDFWWSSLKINLSLVIGVENKINCCQFEEEMWFIYIQTLKFFGFKHCAMKIYIKLGRFAVCR